jgi:hypothetical protein
MKKLIAVLTFLIFTVILIPKEFIYFKIEHILKKENIIINENISSKLNGLILKNGVVYVDNMDLAKFYKANLNIFLVYNNLKIDNLFVNKTMIKTMNISYSLLYPTKLFINSDKLKGEIDLMKRKLIVNGELIKQFDKSGKYETNF